MLLSLYWVINMIAGTSTIFKELEFLGYDPLHIREVLKTHTDFDSALSALNQDTCTRLQAELVNSGISPFTAKRLTQRSQSIQEALTFYNSYMSESETIRKSLLEMGFENLEIQACIDELLPLEIAANELIMRQSSVMTPGQAVNMYSTNSIRRTPYRNDAPSYPANIPNNNARVPGSLPGFNPQLRSPGALPPPGVNPQIPPGVFLPPGFNPQLRPPPGLLPTSANHLNPLPGGIPPPSNNPLLPPRGNIPPPMGVNPQLRPPGGLSNPPFPPPPRSAFPVFQDPANRYPAPGANSDFISISSNLSMPFPPPIDPRFPPLTYSVRMDPPPGVNPQFPPPIGLPLPNSSPQLPFRNNDNALLQRANARVDHASTQSIRFRNDSNQSIRRNQPPQINEEVKAPVQWIQPEVVVVNDSEVSISLPRRQGGMVERINVNPQGIGANFEEAYENITINQRRRTVRAVDNQRNLPLVPAPPQQIDVDDPLMMMRLLIDEDDPLAALIIMRILAEMYEPKGVSEEILQGLNRVVFEKTLKMNCETCVICYDDFVNGVEMIILPCNHPFHSECISTWLKSSKVCPLCKASFE